MLAVLAPNEIYPSATSVPVMANSKAFTLIEIIVTVTILSLLSVAGL
jgi:prepilin-type N-terminal cleavage/methylation domain-containing protein